MHQDKPRLFQRTVRATALALAVPLALMAGTALAQYANDGARQNSAGGWDLPLPQCSVNNAYITYSQCRALLIPATTQGDCTTAYPDFRSGGACDDGVSSNSSACGLAGHTWTQPACRGNLVWLDNSAYVGTDAEAYNNCTRCHNELYMDGNAHSASADVGEGYVMTGHKNMARPLTPTDTLYYTHGYPWAGADGVVYPTDSSGNAIDFLGGTIHIGGSDIPLYWIYNGWIASTPRSLSDGQTYGCARCHTTGFSADASMNTAKEPYLMFGDYTGLFSTAAEGQPYTSWDDWGIQCSRCHGSRLEYDGSGPGTTVDYRHHVNISPEKAAVDGSYYSKSECETAGGVWNPEPNPSYKPYCYTDGTFTTAKTYSATGATRTNLCMDCHRQETSSAPYDSTDPAGDLKVGASHGSLTWFQPFVSHWQGNLYLNSPHGKFSGTFVQIGDKTKYASYFMNEPEKGGCTQCHNVHKSTVEAANPDGGGVAECTECHAKNLNLMKHPKTAGTPFENMATDPAQACEICHMPNALHLFRVNVDPSYSTIPINSILSGSPNAVYPANQAADGSYAKAVWNDLDMTCGQCHGGGTEQVTTTGDATSSSQTIDNMATTIGFAVGQRVRVLGAGSGGADLDTYVTAVGGSAIGIYSAAGTTLASATVVQNPTKNNAGYISKVRLAALATGIHNDAVVAKFSATLGNPYTLTVTVDATASVCQDTCDGYDWDWGDGSIHETGVSTFHTYATGGPKTITLTVIDHGFPSGVATKTINTYTLDLPPSFTGDPCSWDADTWTLSIDGTVPTKVTDDHGIKQEVVNWGDGSLISNDITPPFGLFTHLYTKSGSFSAKITVVDTIGQGAAYSCLAMPTYFTVSGHVYQSDGSTPLPSAKVLLLNGAVIVKTVYTDSAGKYTAGNLKPGTYTVMVTRSGYSFGTKTAVVGPDRNKNFTANP